MQPTPEQQDCIDKFQTGKRLRVNAYAGTGKTSTLTQMAHATSKRGVYVCFNKSIAEEAKKKFPQTIACSTMHALAFRATVRKYGAPKLTGSINGGYLAGKLSLQSKQVAPNLSLTPRGVGYLIAATLRRWQSSGREEISDLDCPLDGRLESLSPPDAKSLQRDIAQRARTIWQRMLDRNDELPLGHDGYLKVWALGRPQLEGDFILLDEAQDTNGVVLELMRHQGAQLVTVGDKHQQIYEWRGALNAMVELPTDLEARLTTSFRFGEAIADYASEILALLGETLPLRGNPARASEIGAIEAPNSILTRNNVTLLTELFALLGKDKRPHIVGGVTEVLSFVTAAEKLMARQSVDYPLEFFGFKDWDEVRYVAQTEDAKELQRWVRLMDDYGPQQLRAALEGLPKSEVDADIVLSTGHKSKGREWGAVRLCNDFLRGIRTDKDDAEKKALDTLKPQMAEDHAAELRLFYVAATRGQEKLEAHPQLAARIEHLQKQQQERAAA